MRPCGSLEKNIKLSSLSWKRAFFFFASRLIDSLEKNHDLVLLIHKKLSASLSVMEYLRDGELGPIVDSVIERLMQRGKSREQAEQTLYIIIEMTGSVCSDAILYQKALQAF